MVVVVVVENNRIVVVVVENDRIVVVVVVVEGYINVEHHTHFVSFR